MNETKTTGAAPDARMPRIAQDAIGRRLRQSFDKIIAEPIPDRFLSLLDTLAQTPTASALGDGDPTAREAASIASAASVHEIAAGKE